MTTATRRLALLAWIAALGGALAALLQLGTDSTGFPPATPDAWGDWIASTEETRLVASVARTVAVALVVYLLAVTVVQLVSARTRRPSRRTTRDARRVGAAPRLAPSFVVTLSAAVVTSSPVLAADANAPGGSVVTPGMGARMERVSPEPPAPAEATELPWADDAAPSTAEPVVPDAPREWLVRPGDHLWRIAEEALARANGLADPTSLREVDVHRYWLALIDANRDRLVDRANPDLIIPGQRFVLP